MSLSSEPSAPEWPALGVEPDLDGPIFIHNELSIRGWAEAPSGISSIHVQIGPHRLTPTQHPNGSRVEFELRVDTSDWERGEHGLEIVASDGDGSTRAIAGTVDVLPYRSPPLGEDALLDAVARGAPAMWYETPELAGGKVADDRPEVTGWALSADGIEAVLVTIDDRTRLRAIHGLARPDLRGGFGKEASSDCGFVVRLDRAELPPGQHVLTIVAVTRGGDAVGIAGTVERVEDLRSGERFVPELHRGTSLEPEHQLRYRWAAPLVAGCEVLDAGCGVGWGTALLAERATAATGVDISPLAIGEADRRHGDAASFRLGDLCRLPFDDATFDAVVSFEAIEHVADPDRALDEMRRVLRPGGLLLISSPNRGVYPEGNPFHLHELTSEELEESLESRFSNVGVYRQQTYVASLLGTDAALRLDDSARMLEAAIVKTEGGPPGSELYTVAAASDGALPRFTNHLALGGRFGREEHLLMIEPWRDRAERAETELAKARTELRALERRLES